jgi:hypothetical protein
VTALLLASVLAAAPAPALGADVLIANPTAGPVVAVGGTVRVASEVVGDVVALAGDIELLPGATVSGDVVAVGGRVSGKGAASGRVVSLGGFAGELVPATGAPATVWGLFLVHAGAWALIVTFVLLVAPRPVRGTAEVLAVAPWRAALIGVGTLGASLVLLVAALAGSGRPLGAALVIVALAAFLFAKVVGVSVVALWLGRVLAPRLPVALRAELPRTGVAALVLAGVAAVPVAGGAIWALANLLGVGAVVATAVTARRHALGPAVAVLQR